MSILWSPELTIRASNAALGASFILDEAPAASLPNRNRTVCVLLGLFVWTAPISGSALCPSVAPFSATALVDFRTISVGDDETEVVVVDEREATSYEVEIV